MTNKKIRVHMSKSLHTPHEINNTTRFNLKRFVSLAQHIFKCSIKPNYPIQEACDDFAEELAYHFDQQLGQQNISKGINICYMLCFEVEYMYKSIAILFETLVRVDLSFDFTRSRKLFEWLFRSAVAIMIRQRKLRYVSADKKTKVIDLEVFDNFVKSLSDCLYKCSQNREADITALRHNEYVVYVYKDFIETMRHEVHKFKINIKN